MAFLILALCLTLLPRGQALAGPSGTWAPTGSMQVSRYKHTATLLPTGTILVTGGENARTAEVLASAELYDPTSNSWSATDSLAVPRVGHTATLLPPRTLCFWKGGQQYCHTVSLVLVAGGYSASNGAGGLASAELYDPDTGRWSATGSMRGVRYNHTATLLPSGQVLAAGGSDGSAILASAELYDPASGTWTPTGSMAAPRVDMTATLLPSGQVLVAGGWSGSGALASAERFDPTTGAWSFTGNMHVAREGHAATLLPSREVCVVKGSQRFCHTFIPMLVTGGFNTPNARLAAAELYDATSGSWTVTGSMNVPRAWLSATLLSTSTVLVAGGVGDSGGLASAELYDPQTGSWSATGSMSAGRYWATATLLPDTYVCYRIGGQLHCWTLPGRLVLAGGPVPSAVTAEVYTP
ncbi:MAG: kelch repeat-containing protein [Mycobacterium sp.]